MVRRESSCIICGVYSIRNIINNKRYIGSSIDIYGRWATHIRELTNNKHPNDHLQKSWNKYGKDSFDFAIIEVCNKENRFECEQKWCDYYQSYYFENGYNIAQIVTASTNPLTIEDLKNGKSIMSYEQYNKIIDLLVNTDLPLTEVAKEVGLRKNIINSIFYRISYKKLTDGIVFKQRKRYTNNKLVPHDIKEIIIKLKSGMHPIDIAKEYDVDSRAIFNIRNHETWKQYTDGIDFGQIDRYRWSKTEGVVQYDLNGQIVNEFKNTVIAEEETGVFSTAISQCCLGKAVTAGGFVWRYGNDPFEKFAVEKKQHSLPSRWNPTPVDQYKDGILINTYKSINEAKLKTGAKNIYAVLIGKNKTSGGFEWKRHDE